jgi:hypothetical protein
MRGGTAYVNRNVAFLLMQAPKGRAFPFSRFAVFPFRHVVLQAKRLLRRRALNGWKSLKVKSYYNI